MNKTTLSAISGKRSHNTVIGAALAGSLLAFDAHAELRNTLPPGGNFALENWSLNLPQDSDGTTQGRAQTLLPEQLSGASGFTSEFFRTDSDGAMTFWVPANGARSPRSDYARSELREMLDGSSNAVNWDSQGKAFLDARLRVLQVPVSNGIVTVGQIHAYDVIPLVALYYQYDFDRQSGQVIAKVQESPSDPQKFKRYRLAEGIPLGQAFIYRLGMERNAEGVAEVSVAINGMPAKRVPLTDDWDSQRFYFKAGAYLNSRSENPEDGARVKFYRLATSHPDAGLEFNQRSALPEAKVGAPYSVKLTSRGGVGGATWRLVSGFPPAGLDLSSEGVISGEAQRAASLPNDFTVQVRDANGNTLSKKFSIVVTP